MQPIPLSSIKKILVSRADRIGDVVLSTPVFRAIKERYPESYLAVLVLKETEAVVRGNPWLDEVIVYDKKGNEKSWWRTIKFGLALRKKQFDVAIHLHSTNRVHLLTWLARIPIRIGYQRKNHCLLTHAIEERKWQGRKHEAEYNFDLLHLIQVPQPDELKLYFPLHLSDRDELTKQMPKDFGWSHYVVFHPSASCVSKKWFPDRLARVADQLAQDYGVSPVIVGEGAGVGDASQMQKLMQSKSLNLSGKLTLGMLGWLLKGARLLISNDSGPVHMACAVGTPVISIFGRNQPGLSAIRWRPLSPRSSFLQKDVGCVECLAHHCQIDFKCLRELRAEEVIEEARRYEACLV